MNIDLLKSELIKISYLRKIEYLHAIDSTNEYCRKNEICDNSLIVTSNQLTGKGRFNRIWQSSPGENLTVTLSKVINIDVKNIFLVNLYTSLCIIKTLKEIFPDNKKNFNLKWPNDILLNWKKICGILTEVVDLNKPLKKFYIGIGINVNQTEFPDELKSIATSLKNEFGVETEIETVIVKMIKNFYDNMYLLNSPEQLITQWKSNSDIIGRNVSLKFPDSTVLKKAKVIDIDFDGGIKVELDNKNIIKYFVADISVIYN
jgi:BirA family biotin operon repressor/biotin-[acetyl-CoA-carboxylase] ligase